MFLHVFFHMTFNFSEPTSIISLLNFLRFKIFHSLVLKPLLPKEGLRGGFTVLFHLSSASRWQPTWSFWILVLPGYSISIQVRRLHSVMLFIHYVFILHPGCAELTLDTGELVICLHISFSNIRHYATNFVKIWYEGVYIKICVAS